MFHYSQYLVAETYEGEPLGSLGGYDPNTHGYSTLQLAITEVTKKLGLSSATVEVTEERAARLLRCIPKDVDGAWVIDSVVTLSEHRGKGIANELMKRILAEGKGHGYSKAQVNVYIGNEPAIRLYLKHGFRVAEEVRDENFEETISSPGMLSLSKDL